jgi:hypothetical protein
MGFCKTQLPKIESRTKRKEQRQEKYGNNIFNQQTCLAGQAGQQINKYSSSGKGQEMKLKSLL